MPDETIQGHETKAFVGISRAISEDQPAKLEDAIHDAALQAAQAGFVGSWVSVLEIEFEAHNPHITQYKVKAVPAG